MKRLLLIIASLLVPSLLPAQTATVTGHMQFPSGGAATNGKACFSLQNFKPNVPRISTTGILVQQQNWCVSLAADGSFNTPIERNDLITPVGTFWRVDFLWNGQQQSSANFLINHTPFNLDIEIPLSQIPTIGPNQIVTQLFSCPQSTASTTWTCTHNFNDTNVQIQAFDLSGKVIYPDTVTGTNSNAVTITFVTAQAGLAVIFHAGSIAIATNQPNAVLQNPTGAQVIGGPTLTINPPTTFGSSVTDTIRDGVYIVGNPTYSCTAGGINQAIADAIAASVARAGSRVGAFVDARACSGNITMTSQINVGNSAQQSVTLWLPNGGVWTFTMTDGTSCGLLQYGGTSIIGPGLGGGSLSGRFEIRRSATASLLANYCTRFAQTGLNADIGYFYASGFFADYSIGTELPTTSGYGAIFAGAFDSSTWDSIEIGENVAGVDGAWVHGTCCSTKFTLVSNSSGGIPLTVGLPPPAAIDNTTDTAFYNSSFDHPPAGKQNILISQGGSIGIVRNINFFQLYGEGNFTGGSTVPMVSIGQNVAGVGIYGGTLNSEVSGGSTLPAIQLETNATSTLDLRLDGLWTTNFQNATHIVNDLRTGAAGVGNYSGSDTTAGNLTQFVKYSLGQMFIAPRLGTGVFNAGLLYNGSVNDPIIQQGGLHYRTDLNRFRWSDASAWHTFIGADTTDSLSNKTLILPSVNGVVISGTPSAGQGLVASSPTAASWANGSLSTTTDGTISGNVTVNNTATTIKAVSVTFPSAGCPCRALLSYSLYLDFTGITNQANIDFWVDDGSGHQMAGVQTGQSNATTGAKTSASYGGFSSVTYNNSASITFTLKGIQSGAGGATVQAAPGSGSGPNSDFQVTVMPSVN